MGNCLPRPWGHSVVTVWCRRYMRWLHHHEVKVLSQCDVTDRLHRWPYHHEVTVFSQDDAHHVRSLWYQNYYITSDQCEIFVRSQWYKLSTSPWYYNIVRVWCRRYTKWIHHLEVTVLSQYDVTGTRDAHITMRSQCCHMTMLTFWGHYDVLMISKLWHHKCEIFIISQWKCLPHNYEVTMLSQCDVTDTWIWHHHEVTVLSQNNVHHVMSSGYYASMMYSLFVRSQWYELTTSPWSHSVVTVWCRRYTRWPQYHHQVTVLSQDDAHSVMSSWHHYDITIKSSHVWVLYEVTVILVWYHMLTIIRYSGVLIRYNGPLIR